MKKFLYTYEKDNEKLDYIIKCQGKLDFIEENFSEKLEKFQNLAIFEEAYYSTKIEGIILDFDKCKKIAKQIENPIIDGEPGDINNFGLQFQGYIKLLLAINKRLDFFKIDTTSLLAMFFALFNIPANYQNSVYRKNDYQEMIKDNDIVSVRVSPVESYETPLYTGSAITALSENFVNSSAQNINNIAKFIVDFMCIRPFDAGCGRIARLFAYLALLKSDINIVKYVSLSKIFESDAAKYYESISKCCIGWDEDKNSYVDFINYFQDCIIELYETLFKNPLLSNNKINKTERIYKYFQENNHEISKKQLQNAHPDISLSTIENTLHNLKKQNKIQQIGGGRSTRYKLI